MLKTASVSSIGAIREPERLLPPPVDAAALVSYLGGPAALVTLRVLAHHPVLLLDGLVIWKKHTHTNLTLCELKGRGGCRGTTCQLHVSSHTFLHRAVKTHWGWAGLRKATSLCLCRRAQMSSRNTHTLTFCGGAESDMKSLMFGEIFCGKAKQSLGWERWGGQLGAHHKINDQTTSKTGWE